MLIVFLEILMEIKLVMEFLVKFLKIKLLILMGCEEISKIFKFVLLLILLSLFELFVVVFNSLN